MSVPAPLLDPAWPQAATLDPLAALRAELDVLDDQLHDTLMRRAGVVAQIGALGVKGRVPLRPGREVAILRRLLARHSGPFPRMGVVRVWRELINAFTAQQRPVLITVCEAGGCEAEGGPALLAAAREQFGALTPMRVHRSPAQAIREVSAGLATAAVLPIPMEEEVPADAWWTALLHAGEPRIHVVARLPFWATRPEGAPSVHALVVAAAPPDPSGADRSLLGLELSPEVGRARLGAALEAAGLRAGPVILRHDPGAAAQALADVEGFVADADPRLAALPVLRPPVVLGAYAIPIEEPAA